MNTKLMSLCSVLLLLIAIGLPTGVANASCLDNPFAVKAMPLEDISVEADFSDDDYEVTIDKDYFEEDIIGDIFEGQPGNDGFNNIEVVTPSCAGGGPGGGIGGGRPGGGGSTVRITLPSYKVVKIDINHIADRHMYGGVYSKGRDLFPKNMTKSQVQSTVKDAYKNRYKKLQTQGKNVKVRGKSHNMTIDMWVNTSTKEIETAYPIW
ncbi:EndoU domain-containing protein [Rossellomorea sp. YZS02]|uniref:EndoU domain-containing protein n=1 Tax=Rossellomorea sp. YZS02 TaxID=3097358 RepID=UPI002A11AF1B|nr:EndoU domain-containing protein [Rossellomorea sp. YZS02]MDX8346148.1 EndoU domain-containing protein [Rossellomorea sp. YZS02]